VFFFSGFDPKGAAYYHRLYCDGAAAQQRATADVIGVGKRERTDDGHVQRWQVSWRPGPSGSQEPVETTFEFLTWDDLVRAHWSKSIFGVTLGSVLAYVAAISSGPALVRVWRQSRRTLVALAYPAAYWLVALLGCAIAGWAAGAVGAALAADAAWWPDAVSAVRWGLGLGTAVGVWWSALWLERRLHTSWLLRIYRFADLWACGRLPDLDQRLDAMAARVSRRVQARDADEVLLVGYSVGSMLSVSVLARVLTKLRADQAPIDGAGALALRLSMLTLGQCVPLLGLMPRARAFRRELAVVAGAEGVCWADYSSPGDWGSFALVDPLEICRVVAPGAQVLKPVMRSPRFHTLFEPQDYAVLKKNKRRLHLQYLMSSPKAGEYDFYRLTAGPARLCAAATQGTISRD
jgi:hypothetical protein